MIMLHDKKTEKYLKYIQVGLWCFMSLSTIFQLYRDGQLRTGFELTTLVEIYNTYMYL